MPRLSSRAIRSSNRVFCRVVSVLTLLPSAPMAEAAALHVDLVLETPVPRGMSLAADQTTMS